MKLTLSLILLSYLLVGDISTVSGDNDMTSGVAEAEANAMAGERKGEYIDRRVNCYIKCKPECKGSEEWLGAKTCTFGCWKLCKKQCNGSPLDQAQKLVKDYCVEV